MFRDHVRTKRWWLAVVLVGLFLLVAGLRWWMRPADAPAPERERAVVRVQSLNSLAENVTVPVQASVESAEAAVLVARAGGRVTSIRHQLGEQVRAGQVVVEIDGRSEPAVARVQIAQLNAALTLFEASRRVATDAAQVAVTLAQQNAAQAQTSSRLAVAGAAVGRQQADLAVESARLGLADARELGVDSAIRAADIAAKTAALAQDQATIGRQLASSGQKFSSQQAALNVRTAQLAKERTATELSMARQQLTTQLALAQEQLRTQQVLAPLAGELTALSVRVGDFLQPGALVGEINAFAGASVRLAVSAGERQHLQVGQELSITRGDSSFSGTITHVASAPDGITGLWQIDIFITETPEVIHPADLVTVHIPVGATAGDTFFLPLKTVNIREGGVVLFTVDAEQRVQAHEAEAISFSGAWAEVRIDLPGEAQIVVEGNRSLTAGQEVSVQ